MKALVLLNMGGARNKQELEMFLRNMFKDKNILTLKSNILRSMLGSLIVLTRKNSAWENYKLIGGFSPINPLTKSLVMKLNRACDNLYVTHAMRYTPPFASECIELLAKHNINEVILLPLYPQYSTTTTKSSLEDFIALAKDNFKIRIIEPFYKNNLFNKLIVEDIIFNCRKNIEYNLIFSAHGLPQKIVNDGDVYEKQINEHIQILTEMIEKENISFKSINLAYQSKVGPMKWLEPSLDIMLQKFKNQNVLIYPISFIVDNSETHFELEIEYKEIAMRFGVKDYKVVPCVNDSEKFIKVIKNLIN